MIANLSSSMSAAPSPGTSSGGGDKTLLIAGLIIGGFLLYKFVIKPEMERQKILKNENGNSSQIE